MIDRLFGFLLALTLLDLAFVHATDVVAGTDLLPLWGLAVGSLFLRRLQRHRLYRAAWNGGVLLVFTLLVHHATTSGLLHMLEDGLVLAVLCQVHLLNNVGERQRPDLIFFNSFLITFVTAFFAPDLAWSCLFVAHAFVLVPSLQMYALMRLNEADPKLLARVWRDAMPRTLAIGTVTALAFVAIPRDFRREGWLGDSLALHQQLEAGLAESIRIDDEQSTRLDDGIVARIAPASGRADDVPAHWRGTAFSTFDGSSWEPQFAGRLGSRFATDQPWDRQPDGSMLRSTGSGAQQRLRLRLLNLSSGRLPIPLFATRVQPSQPSLVMLNSRSDGGLQLLSTSNGAANHLECSIDVQAKLGPVRITKNTRAHLTELPAHGVPEVVGALATQVRASLPTDAHALAIGVADCEWLQTNRRYQLPGEPGFARNLGEFMLGSGAGHCEYFATTLALLLRVQGVPCRVVGGYLAHEWDDTAREILVRGKHAHAWVELLAEDGCWHALDATPAADVRDVGAAADSWHAVALAQLQSWWTAITGFDRQRQAEWLASLATFPLEHPFATAATLALLLASVYLRRRRRQSLPSIVALHRALRLAKLSLQRGETPRELLARAAAAKLTPKVMSRLRTAATHHEACRYGAAMAPNRP